MHGRKKHQNTESVYCALGAGFLNRAYTFVIKRLMNTSRLVHKVSVFKSCKTLRNHAAFSEMHLEADESGSNIAVRWRC